MPIPVKNKIFFFILALIWASFIFYLSSLPDLTSGLPVSYDLFLRKLAHAGVYATLVYLLCRGFDQTADAYLLLAIALAITYSLADEIHQTTVLDRHGSALDIIIDSVGVYCGVRYYQAPRNIKFSK